MKKTLFLGALCIASAASAFEPTGTNSNSSSSDPDETICRITEDTGSRVGHVRVCQTRAQWEAQRRNRRGNSGRSQPRTDPPSS
jgi:hypothetical protein